MSPRERAGALAGFGLLGGYASLHWFALVAEPPLGRWAVCLLVALALALALDVLRARPTERATVALAAGLLVAALAAGLLAAGVPARLLPPGAWGELRAQLDAGLAGISQVDLPYAGPSAWTRIGILIAAPLTLAAAAAVAFWPRQRRPGLRRAGSLALLVALYGVSVTWEAPNAEPLHGLGLLACIAAFLWLGRLPGSRMIAAGAAVLVAGLAALPAAARVDTSDPVINYAGWELFGDERSASFDWDHSYGPLDWPQRGLELFEVRGAQRPMYWRTSVLDEFGGEAWQRSAGLSGVLINRPDDVELSAVSEEVVSERSGWVETLDISVLGLRSPLLVAPGTALQVTGVDVEPPAPDGTTTVASGGLTQGSDYRFTAYVPDPAARLLRRQDDRHYPRGLERYTTMLLPLGPGETTLSPEATAPTGSLAKFTVPLRGSQRAEDPEPGEPAVPASSYAPVAEEASTPYAQIARRAQLITDDARGNYQAVVEIERYLLERYAYNQEVPEHEEPLPAFLFEDEEGYCQHFSGAMALMLRMIGIPSRVATGFAPGVPETDDPGTILVRDTDAHSWVEVWFPRVGWVTVDPTPRATPARTDTSLNVIAAADSRLPGPDRAAFAIEEPRRGREAGDGSSPDASDDGSPLSAIVVFGTLLGLGGTFVVYRRRRARLLRPDGAEPQLRELERAVTLLDRPTGPRLTLLGIEREFAAALGPEPARYPAALRHNRFAPGVPGRPGPEERRMVRYALGRGRGLAGRWRALRAIPPGGPRR